MPTFTAQQRKDITRRQLNIVTENAGYTAQQTQLAVVEAKLLGVDNANAVFYESFNVQVMSYESEVQQINGTVSAEYADADVTNAAQILPGNLFFPTTAPYNAYNNPLIVHQVNGYANPTSTNLLTEELIAPYIQTGMTGTGESTTVVTGPNTANPVVFDVADITNFTALPENVFISDGTNFGLYEVVTATPAAGPIPAYINVNIIIPPIAKPAVGATVMDTVSNTNSTFLGMLVTSWQTLLNSQVTALGAQNDTRSPEQTQNAMALANANTALAAITTWIGNHILGPLAAAAGVRVSYLPTRVTQIVTALGSVIDNGNGTYSDGGTNSSYYNRYNWLNIRINKLTGSLTRYYATSGGNTMVAGLIANNNMILAQYNMYFTTSALMGVDGTDIVTGNTAGFSNGDNVTVVSESQPEIGYVTSPPAAGTVVKILGPQQMQLSFSVPQTYLTTQTELARVFKQL